MFELILQNAAGDQLTFGMNSPFTVTDIQGLNPPSSTINTSQVALMDGTKFNSSKMNMRMLNIAFAIEYDAAKNRLEVFKVLKSKQYVKMQYIGQYRQVYIEGYIESIDITYFEMKQIVTCGIICPSPYFKEAQEVVNELQTVVDAFSFPFASQGGKNLLQNTASTTTTSGITFTVNADGSVTVNGTATSNAYLIVGNVSLIGGVQYALNGCPSGGGSSTYRLYWQGVSGNYDEGEGTTYTPSSDTDINIRIVIYQGATVENLTFYPMVRYAAETNDTYQQFGYGELVFSYLNTEIGITIDNDGDVECGMVIVLFAKEAVSNPKIFNYVTQDYIGLNFDMQQADQITIDTRQGQKSATLLRSGVETNIFNNVIQGSTWLQLSANGDTFVYEVGTGSASDLDVTFIHNNLYEGV